MMTRTMTLVAVAPFALFALLACNAPSGIGVPCIATANCPSDLTCTDGACGVAVLSGSPAEGERVIEKARRELPFVIGDGSITDPEEPNVDPDAPIDPGVPGDPAEPVVPAPAWTVVAYDVPLFDKPRVVPGVAGAGAAALEVYFLEATVGTGATCDGLTRAFPDGTHDPLVGPREGCFKDLDAQRTGDGVVHVVMRNSFTDSSGVVFTEFGPDLLADSTQSIAPETVDEHRGVRARIALTPFGDPEWFWSVRQASGPDLLELLRVDETAPSVVAEVSSLVEDLDYLVDDDGFPAVFFTKVYVQSLVLRTRGTTVEVTDGVVGAIEAVRCGGAMHVAYRKDDQLMVARAIGAAVQSQTVIASGLSSARDRGDVAIACDAATNDVWTAWSDAGAVQVVAPNEPIEIVSAGGGGVSLAIVDGAPHVAFGSSGVNRQLRYATRPGAL